MRPYRCVGDFGFFFVGPVAEQGLELGEVGVAGGALARLPLRDLDLGDAEHLPDLGLIPGLRLARGADPLPHGMRAHDDGILARSSRREVFSAASGYR